MFDVDTIATKLQCSVHHGIPSHPRCWGVKRVWAFSHMIKISWSLKSWPMAHAIVLSHPMPSLPSARPPHVARPSRPSSGTVAVAWISAAPGDMARTAQKCRQRGNLTGSIIQLVEFLSAVTLPCALLPQLPGPLFCTFDASYTCHTGQAAHGVPQISALAISFQDPRRRWQRHWRVWTPTRLPGGWSKNGPNGSRKSAKSKATVEPGSSMKMETFKNSKGPQHSCYSADLCRHTNSNLQPLRLEDPWPSQWRAAPSPASAEILKSPQSDVSCNVELLDLACPKPSQNLFKASSRTGFGKLRNQCMPRGKMFSCSMVSQILFIWSSLRVPPMRRFFCTWSPKWKTAEAILGAAQCQSRWGSVSWWILKARLGWQGFSHSLSNFF